MRAELEEGTAAVGREGLLQWSPKKGVGAGEKDPAETVPQRGGTVPILRLGGSFAFSVLFLNFINKETRPQEGCDCTKEREIVWGLHKEL